MELLKEHLKLAIMLSPIITLAIQSITQRLENNGIELKGNYKFMLSIIIGIVVTIGFGSYYMQLPISETLIVGFLTVIGSQALYDNVIQKLKGDEYGN